jgi:uncharacterized membrane protein
MSDRFHTRLSSELAAWVREGIITEEQRERIAARGRETEAPSRFVAIMSLVGGALLTAGLALVIAHNWDRLTDWTKIAALVVLMTGAYAGGFELKSSGYGRTGESLLMIGAGLFLCGIALVGQIYHLNERPSGAVLLWVVAILPVAYLVRSAPVLLLGVSGTLIWIGWESSLSDSFLYLGCHRWRGWELGDECVWFAMQQVGVAVGAALTAVGALHRGGLRGFKRVFESTGLLVMGASLYALGFTRLWWKHSERGLGDLPLAPVLGWAFAAALLIAAAWRHLPPQPPRPRGSLTAAMLGAVLLAAAPTLLGRMGYGGSDARLGLTLLFWVMQFVLGFLWIACGVRWRKPGWLSIGLLFIGLTIVTRYFDVLGSRLDQGLFYILGGILILTLSLILERQRRRLLARLERGVGP